MFKKNPGETLQKAQDSEFNTCNKEEYIKYLIYFINLTENRTEKGYWARAWLWRDNKELILDMHTEFHKSLVEVQSSMSSDENSDTDRYYIFSKEKFEALNDDNHLRTKLLKMIYVNSMNKKAYESFFINLYMIQFCIFILRRSSSILRNSVQYLTDEGKLWVSNMFGYLDYVIMRLLLIYQANAKGRCKRITELLRGHPIGDIKTEVKDRLGNSFKLYKNDNPKEKENPLDNKEEMLNKCDYIFHRRVLDFGPRLRCRRLVGARINLNQVLDEKCEPKIIRSAHGGKKRLTRRVTRAKSNKSNKNNKKTSNVHMSRVKSNKNTKKRRRTKKMYGGITPRNTAIIYSAILWGIGFFLVDTGGMLAGGGKTLPAAIPLFIAGGAANGTGAILLYSIYRFWPNI